MIDQHVIAFPETCDLFGFEEFLSRRDSFTLAPNCVTFDFTRLQWIGILQLSVIFGWIWDLRHAGKQVAILMPPTISEAAAFLATTSFCYEVQKIGCSLPSSPSTPRPFGLAAFKVFESQEALSAYERALTAPSGPQIHLGSAADAPLIKEGAFRTILLHELGDNTFQHGGGVAVRYAVSVHPASPDRSSHPFLSAFDGRPYLEVVVSDSGRGLLRKDLRGQMPNDYLPSYALKGNRRVSKDAITAAFAFEFSSTRDPETRRQRLTKMLDSATELTNVVATGLWYVAGLMRHYGGQILVRTGALLVNIDFSNPREPNGTLNARSTLRSLRGTHVWIRVPRDARHVTPIKHAVPHPRRFALRAKIVVNLEEASIAAPTPAGFIQSAERRIEEALLKAQKERIPVVSLLCDGLNVDHKAFSVLLTQIAVTPRRGRALVMLGVKREVLIGAREQWERIQRQRKAENMSMSGLYGHVAFVLVAEDLSEQVIYGDKTLNDSTILTFNDEHGNGFELSVNDVADLYHSALKLALIDFLNRPPVRHPDGYYYLIEEPKYYTRQFYEIRRVLSSAIARALCMAYFTYLLSKHNVGAIYTIAEPMEELVDAMQGIRAGTKWFKRVTGRETSSFVEAIHQKPPGTKLFVLTDVICTGSEVRRFLVKAPDLNDLVVGCFVDGRQKQFDYLSIDRQDRSHTVAVESVLRLAIEPIYDIPHGTDPSKILIVDRKTHAPTTYDFIQPPTLLPEELLELAHGCGALRTGHLVFGGKHYTIFIVLAVLVPAMHDRLVNLWDGKLAQFDRTAVEPQSLVVLYVDEERGWESLVPQYFSTKTNVRCARLSLDELEAPPPSREHGNKEKVQEVWLVLGVMAYGDTASRALEYVSRRFAAQKISVIVLIARMDTTRLSFWQNITSYKSIKVHFDILSYLPVEAYDATTSCPFCNLNARIDVILGLTESYGSLYRLAEARARLFAVSEVQMSNQSVGRPSPQEATAREPCILKSLYRDALRSVTRRKDLDAKLARGGAIEALLPTFGEDVFSPGLSPHDRVGELQRILYNSHDALKAHAEALLSGEAPQPPSIQDLLAISALYPDLLEQYIVRTIRRALLRNNQALCEDLTFLALLRPSVSSGLVLDAVAWEPSDEWARQLKADIVAFPHWIRANRAVEAYLDLVWLLKRSTPWNEKLAALGLAVKVGDHTDEQIATLYRSLYGDGIRRVFALISQLKVSDITDNRGSLWSALRVVAPNVDNTVERLTVTCDKLRNLVFYKDSADIRDQRLATISNLVDEGKALREQLELLYLNPIDVQRALQRPDGTIPLSNLIKISILVDPGAVSVLTSLEDLKMSLLAVLENAERCVSEMETDEADSYWLEVKFLGGGNGSEGVMTIRDNLPWKSAIQPTGGLQQFADYCLRYSAIHTFNPVSDDQYLRIRVQYRTMDRT